ncbi:MAG: thiamine pyrophosphate-dependent enzyme [Polyangiales bacterium]|nr:3-methyl-2-oxobutanoate dehydrogenase [Myxococcales bacterium]
MLPLDESDPTLGLVRAIDEHGVAARPVELDTDLLVRMYREMRRIRMIDERMLARQRQGKVGFYGTITGQEAVPIAAALAIEPRDWVFPALRESAMMLVRGFPLDRWLAQVYGNAADVQKGRQMPSHQSSRSVNQVSWSSCIGPQLPHAVGAAWAAKLRGDDVVTLGFLGDGATSQGDFHCAMNFAGVFKTPCVLLCQNNHWAISVSSAQQTASETFALKAHAYGVRGIRVDGNDAVAVYEVTRAAVEHARRTSEPTFIEAVTYRMGPHSSSDDPTRYQASEDVTAWKLRDPITRLRTYLVAKGALDDSGLKQIDQGIDTEISAALRMTEAASAPARASLFDDVFAALPWHLREQRAELMKHTPPRAHGHG